MLVLVFPGFGLDEVIVYLAGVGHASGGKDLAEVPDAPIGDKYNDLLLAIGAQLANVSTAERRRYDQRALAAVDQVLVSTGQMHLRNPSMTFDARGVEAPPPHRLRHPEQVADRHRRVETALLDQSGGVGVGVAADPPVEPLTHREQVILGHMATMQTNGEIADELFVSVNTVKVHAQHIYRKLAVSSRRDAVRRAHRLGLI